ncbi:PcfJ domain-containing protein [Thioalkalivibrio thiocyanodenitrificans]|uniref:PcfJ domain-containing protein n=1 Tax=Thioalkalivibrio thiocyanodenitrificans TaxID=243063 RepID=UPI0003A66E0E|nr:PcfJ domain-containing protein [Thioalkalivibrio thiocyanodenitrificans]
MDREIELPSYNEIFRVLSGYADLSGENLRALCFPEGHMDVENWPLVVSGQAVASAVLHLLGIGPLVIKDIDVFYPDLTEHGPGFRVENPHAAGNLENGWRHDDSMYIARDPTPVPCLDNDAEYDLIGVINSEKVSYMVKRTMTAGILNLIEVNAYGPEEREMFGPELIKRFDLNCVQVALDLNRKEVCCTGEFLEFLRSYELRITRATTPYRTLVRYFDKKRQLGCYGNDRRALELVATTLQAVKYRQVVRQEFDESSQTMMSCSEISDLCAHPKDDDFLKQRFGRYLNKRVGLTTERFRELFSRKIMERSLEYPILQKVFRLVERPVASVIKADPRYALWRRESPAGDSLWGVSEINQAFVREDWLEQMRNTDALGSEPVVLLQSYRLDLGMWSKAVIEQYHRLLACHGSKPGSLVYAVLLNRGPQFILERPDKVLLARLDRIGREHPTAITQFTHLPVPKLRTLIDGVLRMTAKYGPIVYGALETVSQPSGPQYIDVLRVLRSRLRGDMTVEDYLEVLDGYIQSELEQMNRTLAEPFFGAVTLEIEDPERVRVEELVTGTRLYEEGVRMHHCVGGYMHAVEKGSSRIFSLTQCNTGERVTLELKMAQGGARIAQNRGPYNREAPETLRQAAQVLCDQVNTLLNQDADPYPDHEQVWRPVPMPQVPIEEQSIPF